MGALLDDLMEPKLVLARDLAYTQYEYAPLPPLPRKKRAKSSEPRTHIIVGDTQIKEGVDTRHLDWVGSFIADEFTDHENVQVWVLGDWWDMPSLSSWDGKGSKRMENQRVTSDVAAGNEAFARFDAYLPKKKSWEYHFLFGNHEDRITRAVYANPQNDTLSLALLDTKHFERHPFLEVVWSDGIAYSHYFHPASSGRAYGGSIENRLARIGHSFTMGHQQGLLHGMRPTLVGTLHGLVLGSTYLHDEDYMAQGNSLHFRGIMLCRQVEGGNYDPQQISLDYLCRRYEGIRLTEYLEKTRV